MVPVNFDFVHSKNSQSDTWTHGNIGAQPQHSALRLHEWYYNTGIEHFPHCFERI